MRRAAEKLKSRRGASILLALVFVLLCVMVGTSILAAASSNAGRTRSNHDEQQIYLALSSSLRLVADELTAHPYIGAAQYDCTRAEQLDSSGNVVTDPVTGGPVYVYTYTFHGAKGSMTGASLGSIFTSYLDQVFAGYLDAHFSEFSLTDDDTHKYGKNFSTTASEQSFDLELTPAAGSPLEDYKAKVNVTIRSGFRIELHANLTALPNADASEMYDNYYMEVTLSPDSDMPVLTAPTGSAVGLDQSAVITNADFTWTMGAITSGYATPSPAPGGP